MKHCNCVLQKATIYRVFVLAVRFFKINFRLKWRSGWSQRARAKLSKLKVIIVFFILVMFSIMDWESHRSTPPFEFTTLRIHWYDPISSGYLTAELGISKCKYDDMTLLIDALTVTPVFFSNFLSCQNDDVTFVTDTTLLSDLFNWMLEIPMILVPLTIQLIFTPDFPYSINAGSTFIDMEPITESTNTRFSEWVFI